MRKLFVFLGVALTAIGSAVSAQEVDSIAPLQKSSRGDAENTEVIDYIPEISLDMRGGYAQDFAEKAGRFYGDGLYLDINGRISKHFSYSLNQRLASSYYEDNSGFNGTNWLTLTYEIGNFALTAGKDAIFVGSFEYDAYDLDSYYSMNSLFYNFFDCWQWGVSATWYPSDTQSVAIQAANSPFSYGAPNLFAYAAAWRGEWDCYESYWSANLWQYDKGSYVKALNFGNRFSFGGFSVDLEYMTRAADIRNLFTKDFTLLAAPSYTFADRLRILAKIGWERATEEVMEYDFTGDNLFYGAGVEFFPIKDNDHVRIHAAWTSDTMYTGGHRLDIGLTWKFGITSAVRRLLDKKRD